MPLNYFPTNLSRTYSYAVTTTNGAIPIGTASPKPAASPTTTSGSYTSSITSGASFNGLTGLQALTSAQTGNAPGNFNFASGPGASGGPSTTYQALQAGNFVILGQSFPSPLSQTITYPAGYFYAAVPFVTGAVVTNTPAYNGTATSSSQTTGSLCRQHLEPHREPTVYQQCRIYRYVELHGDGQSRWERHHRS